MVVKLMVTQADIIKEVIRRQATEGLTDQELAKRMKIDRHTLKRIKQTLTVKSQRTWWAIQSVYPDLLDPILDILSPVRSDDGKGNKT